MDEFWSVVELARSDARLTGEPFDGDAVGEALVARLTTLSLDEILDFNDCFDEVTGSLDTAEIALACLLITGYLSDDGFSSFVAGLVALGREAVEQTVTDPDSIAGHPLIVDIAECRLDRFALDSEGMLFAALHAYAELSDGDEEAFWNATSDREAAAVGKTGSAPKPEPRDTDAVLARIPRLAALFPKGRWKGEEPGFSAPEPDPHERCPVCGSALATQTAGSSRRQPDGSVQALEFRRCLTCSLMVSRTKQGEVVGPWEQADPAQVGDELMHMFDLLVPTTRQL